MISPRPVIAALERTSEKEAPRFGKTRLDRNERTHPFGAAFLRSFRRRLSGEAVMMYPNPEALYARFARWLRARPEELLFHTGSDLAIKAVFETFVRPGDRILLHRPGYAMYGVYAAMFGAKTDSLDYDARLRFDLDAYAAAITRRHRLVVLENPNGFVGDAHPLSKVRALIGRARRQGALALIDEAYFHFHPETAARWIRSFDNLIVVRTFSKAFGLAGLRAAYLLAQPRLIDWVRRVKPMHELNSAAIAAVDAMLDNAGDMRRFVRDTRDDVAYLRRELDRLGIDTSDSRANFVAARLGPVVDAAEVSRRLRGRGILIRRPFREPHLREWLRIGTSPRRELRALVEVLRRAAKGRA